MKNRFLVIDVESIGLHGEGFDVGGVVIDNGIIERLFRFTCEPVAALGYADGLEWAQQNVPMPTGNSSVEVMVKTPREVRNEFWKIWSYERGLGTVLVADCPWPVEARFLAQCVDDDPVSRTWSGPYPLIDVASVRLAGSLDPLGTEDRRDDEMPAHNPLADAMQSARLLTEALVITRGAK